MTRYQTEQSRTPIRWSEAAALIGVVLAALILAILLLSPLLLAAAGSPASRLEWIRAYLFRNAVKNTLAVMAVAIALGLLFAWLAGLAARDASRYRTLLLYTLLVPLATPAPLAALLWRMTLTGDVSGFQQPLVALAATGMVSVWRVAPLLALILLAGRRRSHVWLAVGALAAYAAAADVTAPLLLTGGEPFNATHTLASWTFQLAAVNHGWRASAAAALVWLGLLALPAGALLFALGGKSPTARLTSDRLPRSRTPVVETLAAILLLVWMLTPLIWPALNNPAWTKQIIPLFRSAAYWRGWFNALLLAASVALVAAPVTGVVVLWMTAGQRNMQRKSTRAGIGRGLIGLALLSWPVAFVGLGWLAVRTDIGAGAVLWLFYTALTICSGVGLASMSAVENGRNRHAAWAVAIGFLVIWHGFPGLLILHAPSAVQPVGAAIAMNKGAPIASNSPLLAASLATSLLVWLAFALALNYAKSR